MKKVIEALKNHPLYGIFILGFIIRIIFLLAYYFSPDWNFLMVDSLYHHNWAKAIAGGDLLGKEVFMRAPFYIYLLGGLYAIFGSSLWVGRILGLIIGLISIGLTFGIARKIFDKKIAIIAGCLHALYPIAIYFENELLVDSLFTLFVELSILLFLLAFERKSIKYFVWSGLVIGLAAITRPIILGLIPLYLIWIILNLKESKLYLKAGLLLIFMCALAISPATLRNAIVADDVVLIAASGGVNFYIGNNAAADGLTASVPPFGNDWQFSEIKSYAEKESGRVLSQSELSDFWMSKGLNWIWSNKSAFIGLFIKKLYFAVNNFEVSNNRNLTDFFSSYSILKYNPLCFGIVFPLAIIGFMSLLIYKKLNRITLFLFFYIMAFLVLLSLFFINARFRLPVLPLIFIFSANGIDYLAKTVYRLHFDSRQIIVIVPGLLFLILSFSNIYGLNKTDTTKALFDRANYYMRNDNFKSAADNYRLLLRQNPNYPGANLNFGVLFLKNNNLDSAHNYFRRELKINQLSGEAHANLAAIAYQREKYSDCWMLAMQAIKLKPTISAAYIYYFKSLLKVQDSTSLGEILALGEANLDFAAAMYYEAGLVFSGWFMYDKAVEYFTKVLSSQAAARETGGWSDEYSAMDAATLNNLKALSSYQLGYIYGIMEYADSSIYYSEQAIALDSNLAEAYINLANMYVISNQKDKASRLITVARSRFPSNDIFIRMQNSL